ncbi:MAG: PepSY domain-containing protein [Chitinophagaceae bacterium]
MNKISRISKSTRMYRSLHNKAGIILLLLILISASTGILLGWKKNSMGYLQAATAKGTSPDPARWLPIDTLIFLAGKGLQDSLDKTMDLTIDRIDIRPDKGIAKFVYLHHFQSVQMDLTSGKVLGIEVRRSDWIEKLHDGSLLDYYIDAKGTPTKLIFTTVVGLGLLLLCFSGFWLWINPRRIRNAKENR